jgi:hypothetical protein
LTYITGIASRLALAGLFAVGYTFAASTPKPVVDTAGFDAKVKPLLKNTCTGCHNPAVMSGDVDLMPYLVARRFGRGAAAADQQDQQQQPPPKTVPPPKK